MVSKSSQAKAPIRRSRAALALLAAAAFAASCQSPAPTTTFGLDSDRAQQNPFMPGLQISRKGNNDTFFTLSLPPEPDMPKHVVKVSGTPGAFATPLASESGAVVTSIIPNTTGFIIEGANLDKATQYLIGATAMTVRKRTKSQLVIDLPKNNNGKGIVTLRDAKNLNIVRAAADASNVYVNGRAVLRYRDGASRTQIEAGLKASGALYYRFAGMNFVVAYYNPETDWTAVEPVFRAQSVFTDVTRDTLYRPRATGTTEPRYGEQWYLPKINAPEGWKYTAGSPDAIVAVLDTGIQTNHPELSANIYRNAGEVPGNGVDDDGNGRIDDVTGWNTYDNNGVVDDQNGHGTQMAGIIAAAANNAGIAGLAYAARVIPIKVATDEGIATSSSLIDGINYAVRNRASVLSICVATKINDAAVKSAVEFATTFNVTVVAAMGNDGARVLEYPAGWSKELPVIAVGATNSVDARPSWANYGDWMTVCAPGEAILTTTKASGYTTISGTSPATALTSALAALVKGLKPGYTPAMVKDVIAKTAVDLGPKGFDNDFGWGRITIDTSLADLSGAVDVDASSEHQSLNFPPSEAMDKDTETYWSSARRNADNPEWLTLDMGSIKPVTSVAAMSAGYYSFLFPADFTIEVSKDGASWTPVIAEVDFRIPESTWHRWNIAPVQTRYVRMNITRSRLNPDNNLYYDQVAEFVVNGEENAIVKTASSNYYGVYYHSKYMYDRNPNTFWVSANRTTMQHEFAIADLGVSQAIRSIDLLCPPRIISEAFPKSFSLYVSNDKINWTWVKDVKNEVPQPDRWFHYPITPTTGRYVRVDITETNRARSHGSLFGGFELSGYTAAIAEVEINR